MEITKDILYIGVKDTNTDLFEGQYKIPNGITYNSYLIKDKKTTVMDTVDGKFTDEWLNNLNSALEGTIPDYIVIQHMEPDHSASLKIFCEKYPNTKIVANAKAQDMIKHYFGDMISNGFITVANGETLDLGCHKLTFIFAPMVHWPEVMVTYDSTDCVLFSADAFGRFGADENAPWDDEARRYYIGIVGKYGAQVQSLLKKAADYPIKTICSLHGPILREGNSRYIELYDKWSSYTPETEGVLIAYTSVYGHTKEAAELLKKYLIEKGETVKLIDLARTEWSFAVAEAFRFSKIVLATTTYNNDIFPFMRQFIDHLTERNFQNRKVGLIENGSWAPTAAKIMTDKLSGCKNLTFCENKVTVKAALNSQSIDAIKSLSDEICN